MPQTVKAADPLEDVREVAEATGLAWATDRWLRVKCDRLVRIARDRDLSAEAGAIARLIEANPVYWTKEAGPLRRNILALLGAIIAASPGPAQGRRRRTG